MNKTTIMKMVILPMLLASPLIADEITDQIKLGLTAYEEKDYKTAVEELKYATAALESLNQEENMKLLPEAMEGWIVKEGQNNGSNIAMTMFGGGGSSMKREYHRDREKVTIEVTTNSPMLSIMSMMIKNPAMMASKKNTKPFRYKKAKGMKKMDGNKPEITLLLAGQILLKLTGRNLEDSAVLEEYLKKMDMSALKEALL